MPHFNRVLMQWETGLEPGAPPFSDVGRTPLTPLTVLQTAALTVESTRGGTRPDADPDGETPSCGRNLLRRNGLGGRQVRVRPGVQLGGTLALGGGGGTGLRRAQDEQ